VPAVTQLSEAKRKLLESYLHGGAVQAVAARSPITPRTSQQPAPLSLSQEQLFLRETRRPGIPPLYNECIQLRMTGPIQISLLERSLAEIIRRHEIWRTNYVTTNGQPVQVVHPAPAEAPVEVIDLRGVPRDKREAEAHQIIQELARQRFNLSEGPLLNARLIRLDEYEHRLYLIAHLSVVDGLSVYRVFPQELAALYSAYSSGQPSPLRNLPIQFGDYAHWQRQWLEGEELARQLDYWRTQLRGGIPPLKWPTDRPRPREETFRGTIRPFDLPRTVVAAVKALARQEGATLFVTLLAAFATLLHSYTQQDDFVIGTPSPAGRTRSEVQALLGYFLTPVALRFQLASRTTFRELLRQTQRLTLEAISHNDVPVELLARELRLPCDPTRNPLFTVAISLQPTMPQLDLNWSVTSMDVESGGSPWDLYIAFIEGREGMTGRVQYNPDLFHTETITQMLQHYQRTLEIVSACRSRYLSELHVLAG
jgi:condensation domain-containing protein